MAGVSFVLASRAFRSLNAASAKWVAVRAFARNIQTRHTTEVIFRDYRLDPRDSQTLFTGRALGFDQ